jgi:hypothetical protein
MMKTNELKTGQRIEAGTGDDRERGTVGAIDGARVTVQWDSGIVTSQPMAALDDLEVIGGKTTRYEISDTGANETADRLTEAAEIAAEWYDYLTENDGLDELPPANLDDSSLAALVDSIAAWENRIAEAMGNQAFHGHGNYSVSAACQAGLDLRIREVTED